MDSRGFGGDSLFCEYAYVIDFDKDVLEVYEGSNKTPTPADSRFPSGAEWLDNGDGYEPVALVSSFLLCRLPEDDEFCAELASLEEAA